MGEQKLREALKGRYIITMGIIHRPKMQAKMSEEHIVQEPIAIGCDATMMTNEKMLVT
jgi:hypothetical protein